MGDTLLHSAVELRPYCPPQLFENLLRRYPHQASIPDDQGRLPLHLACLRLSDRDDLLTAAIRRHTVRALLRANPAAASVVDARGHHPLRIALEAGATSHDDVDAVTDLYLAHREALPSDRAYSVLTVSRASDALVRLLRDETDPRVVAAALHAYHDDADVAARCCDALAAGVADDDVYAERVVVFGGVDAVVRAAERPRRTTPGRRRPPAGCCGRWRRRGPFGSPWRRRRATRATSDGRRVGRCGPWGRRQRATTAATGVVPWRW